MLSLIALARARGALPQAAAAAFQVCPQLVCWVSGEHIGTPFIPQLHHNGQPLHRHGFSTSEPGSKGSSHQQQQQQQQAGVPPLSKSFVAGKLSQEELWMAGIPGKLKIWAVRKHPGLKGREMEVVDEVRNEFLSLLTRHATGRELSPQTRAQLKLACLAAATHDVLLRETGGDGAAVDEHIRQSMGSLYAPFLLGSLKAVAWVKRVVFNQAPLQLAVGTLGDIAKDMQGGCSCRKTEDIPAGRAALDVDVCMFHEVLAAEGKTQLLAHLCCQHNVGWLEAYRNLGVGSRLEQCMARGDAGCRIAVWADGAEKGVGP